MWQALLPLLIFLSTSGGILEETNTQDEAPSSPVKDRHTPSTSGSKPTLLLLTVSGVVAVYAHLGSISAVALGLSYAVLQVLAFHLVERARAAAQHHVPNGGSVIYSASGLLTQPTKPPISSEEQWLSLIRDVSTAGALATGVAALTLESLRFGGLAYYGLLGQAMGDHWVFGQGVLSLVYALGTIIVHMAMYGALLLTVSFRTRARVRCIHSLHCSWQTFAKSPMFCPKDLQLLRYECLVAYAIASKETTITCLIFPSGPT